MGKNTGKKVSSGVNICIREEKILFPRGKKGGVWFSD
jgi:hypothetical protein